MMSIASVNERRPMPPACAYRLTPMVKDTRAAWDPKLAAELVVERDEVAVQLSAPLGLELARDGLRRAVAGREQPPNRLAVRLAQHGRAGLELEVERRPEQLLDSLLPAPLERRGRRPPLGP